MKMPLSVHILGACALATGCAATQASTNERSPQSPDSEAYAMGSPGDGDDAAPARGKSPSSADAEPQQSSPDAPSAPDVKRLEVAIASKSGSTLVGKAKLVEVPEGVQITVRLDQAEPGLHGVHIHETPDCSAPDASSAGGHYNPGGEPHGLPSAEHHHLGDLGNLGTAPPNGKGVLEITVPNATLNPEGSRSLLNHALVVHSNQDTGEQPTGSSGKRVGCAVLTPSAAERQEIGEVATE